MLRRRAEGSSEVPDAAGARALAAEIRERAARIRTTPGLLDGALDEVRGAIERLLREYEKISRRRLGPFERDLESVAKRAKELRDAGRLTSKHMRLVGQALQHAKRVHFWNAKRVLVKFDKILEATRALQQDAGTYRAFHRKASQRVRDAEDALAKLRAVPRPAASSKDVARARSLVEACNRAADDAWAVQTHRPVAESLKDVIAHPDVDGLGLLSTQEFACMRELSDLLEAQPDLETSIGPRPLAELVGTSEYSVGKWDRVYPQAAHERRKLQDLFHQLKPVVTGIHGAAFGLDLTPPALERRVAAWRRFPGSEGDAAWGNLAELVTSGTVPAVQESARVYERFGDLAKRAFTGDLAEEIREQESERLAARKALEKLPSPDSLLG